MEYTSAQANKLLIGLMEERSRLLDAERQSRQFVAATIEDPESVRPAYDYAETQRELDALEQKIRAVKHAISSFNLTHEVCGMTVDQLLVYLPQLKERKAKLGMMAKQLPKARENSSMRANIIEYCYTNYDPAAVERDYRAVSRTLADAQLALDTLNTTATMEIEL